jgi:sugar/nucleoside kinase (ribokinase family)
MKAFVGFDGFIDRLAKVVMSRGEAGGAGYYPDIASFASRIAAAAGRSADLELDVFDVRPGGNAPIMAHALGVLGASVTCTGAVGDGELIPAFEAWRSDCRFIPLGPPGHTLSLEFNDGKIMMADLADLDKLTWDSIEQRIGLDRMIDEVSKCCLVALVNWSSLLHGTEIWKQFGSRVLTKAWGVNASRRDKKYLYFDITDMTKHNRKAILECLDIILSYRAFGRVILGLNENEAFLLSRAVSPDTPAEPETAVKTIYAYGAVDTILVHPISGCHIVDEKGSRFINGPFIEKPLITTGGGDHFNAGYVYGIMQGMAADEAVHFALKTASSFVAAGRLLPE